MCCFTRGVVSVSATQIFARAAKGNRQYLVYSMTMSAKEDLAMVLPLPVPPGPPEDAVRFISLEAYPTFFKDLRMGFPKRAVGRGFAFGAVKKSKKLEVVEVGEFEASFVPAVKDFERLDERFRMPKGTWDKLPAYGDYGFAVFKLKKGAKTIHPMAFEFPRRDPRKLFFPTVHIHDGEVHAEARFDHSLYYQKNDEGRPSALEWEESTHPASRFVKLAKSGELVHGGRHVYRREIKGMKKNEDIFV